MKVLVTGGGGFLGSAICRQLLARGDDVIAYQRSASEELEKLGARIIQGSITDAELLNAACQGCRCSNTHRSQSRYLGTV